MSGSLIILTLKECIIKFILMLTFSFGKAMAPNKSSFRSTEFEIKMKKFGHRTRDFFKGTLFENFIKF